MTDQLVLPINEDNQARALGPQVSVAPLAWIPDIDFLILSHLDGASLTAMSSVNKYFHSLCQNETLWQKLVDKDYPGCARGKAPGETWQEFYRFLVKATGKKGLSMKKVIEYDRLELLKIHRDKVTPYFTEYAVRFGRLRILEWVIREMKYPCISISGIFKAVEKGYLDILKLLRKIECLFPSDVLADMAAIYGQLEVLKWLLEEDFPPPDQEGINQAAINGHFKVVKWLFSKTGIHPSPAVINAIAVKGSPEFLDWMEREFGIKPD